MNKNPERNNLNYSVIIPHKNTPHFLDRCIASIPVRNDVEIIVVDDASDVVAVDSISLSALPAKYPHVQFVWAENDSHRRGAGYARNIGMKLANGHWLVFADADDYFLPPIWEAFDRYKDSSAEIIYFMFKTFASGFEKYQKSARETIQTKNWQNFYVNHSPWARFVKRSVVVKHDIAWEEVPYQNDMAFGFRLEYLCEKREISELEIYFYGQDNKSSISSNRASRDSRISRYMVVKRIVSDKSLYGEVNRHKLDLLRGNWIRLLAVDWPYAFREIRFMMREDKLFPFWWATHMVKSLLGRAIPFSIRTHLWKP